MLNLLEVFKVLYDKFYIRPDAVRACRQVCSYWNDGIDNYFQTTNFHCLENKNGPRNFTEFVLTMPMELADIDRIKEMELYPTCVSFGKKITLLMRHERDGVGLFPSHLREIGVLLQTVSNFWRRFEHLEVRHSDVPTDMDVDYAARWLLRSESPNYIVVPLGDVGNDETFQEHRTVLHTMHIPDEFEMYIPFLHLMTNLKKVTLRINDNWISALILHRIPKTSNLTEIYTESPVELYQGLWSTSCAVMYQKCANNVTFLAGVTPVSISTMVDCINPNGGVGPVFEKLKELHILVDPGWRYNLAVMISSSSISLMFPMVTILGLSLDRLDVYDIQRDLWKHLGTFVNTFPRLNHLSFFGQRCISLHTSSEFGFSPTAINCTSRSVLTTIQLQCPIHVPVELLHMFPSLTHVLIEECPGRCQLRESRANSFDFVDCFFKAFPNVNLLSFVPHTTGEQTQDAQTGFSKVTRFKSSYKGDQYLCGKK